MHFRVTDAFTFLQVFVSLSILSMASPLSSSSPTNVTNGLDVRQAGIIVDGEKSSSIYSSLPQMR